MATFSDNLSQILNHIEPREQDYSQNSKLSDLWGGFGESLENKENMSGHEDDRKAEGEEFNSQDGIAASQDISPSNNMQKTQSFRLCLEESQSQIMEPSTSPPDSLLERPASPPGSPLHRPASPSRSPLHRPASPGDMFQDSLSSVIPNAQPDKHNLQNVASCHEVSSAQPDEEEITSIPESQDILQHQPREFQTLSPESQRESSVLKSQYSQEIGNLSALPALGGSPMVAGSAPVEPSPALGGSVLVAESTPVEPSRPVQIEFSACAQLNLSPARQNTSMSKEVGFKKKIIFNSSSSELEDPALGANVEMAKISGTEADTEDSEKDKEKDKTKEATDLDDSDCLILSPHQKSVDKIIVLDSDNDNSFKLEISDTESPVTKKTLSLSSGSYQKSLEESTSRKDGQESMQMSQVLVPDNLLCQDVNAIENDQDMKEVSQILDDACNVVEEVVDADTVPSDDMNDSLSVLEEEKGTKRTAKDASLSSADEQIRKKSDLKDERVVAEMCSSGSTKLTPADSRAPLYTKLNEKSSASHLADDELTSSRPGSSHALQSPDISCSPIQVLEDHESNRERGKRKTSTPGDRQSGGKGLSSPQKQLRKRMLEQEVDPSSEDDTSLAQRRERKKGKKKEDSVTQSNFKEPSPLSSPEQSIRLKLDAVSEEAYGNINLADLQSKLPPGFTLGLHIQGPGPLPVDNVNEVSALSGWKTVQWPVQKLQKRMSDVSFLSSNSGGSSGYLGGASSGISGSSGSSGRSRLSIMPETKVEKHQVVAPLPRKARSTSTQDSMAVQVGSQAEVQASVRAEVKFVSDSQMQDNSIQSQLNVGAEELTTIQEEVESVAGSTGKKKRKSPVGKGKAEGTLAGKGKAEGTPAKNKLSRKKRKTSTSSTPRKERDSSPDRSDGVEVQEKIPVPAESLKEPEHGMGVGSRVFARWKDGMGVFFYPAVVIDMQEGKVKVKFLEDRVELWVNIDGECFLVAQLSPGNQVTVDHDYFEAYKVTATLLSFPSRDSSGDIQYELEDTPKAGEPDKGVIRTIIYREVCLTDQQANAVLNHLGVASTSNRVSADLNFGNLVFTKRKSRPLESPMSSPAKLTPGKKGTPRRKRGGVHVEDSQHTYTESSAAEMATPTTPKRKTKPKVAQISTTEDEAPSPRSNRKFRAPSGAAEDIFLGMSFVLTQSTAPEDNQDTGTETETDADNAKAKIPKFDRDAIKAAIKAGGGKIMPEFPTQLNPIPTAGTEMVVISDRACRTMTYLLALASSTPVVNFQFILDSTRAGKRLDYKFNYLLPAGQSELLQMELEQEVDYRKDLEANGCIQPKPPATSTRHKGRGHADDNPARKKVLAGLNVLVLSKEKWFTEDWQSVLVAIGASVNKKHTAQARLNQIRAPDLVVCDTTAPSEMVQDLQSKPEIPIVTTKWIIECVLTNAKVAYNNFICELPTNQ